MKMSQGKKNTLILSLLVLVTLFWYQSDAIASAATPTFSKSKVEIVGEDETYQLTIKNQVKGSTYKWSSSKTSVAKVSKKGLVTSVNKGSTTITCKITYPTKKTKTITCKVTVVIPATKIRINNANDEINDSHKMNVGDSYNFNRDIEPKNSSDKTYWHITEGNAEVIRIDNSSNGTVTALKPGKVVLTATAVKSPSSTYIENSIVNDAIIIEVVTPKAAVNSAEITGSTEVKVIFDSAIDQSTVIGADGKLLDSIDITARKNVKGVLAKDPGALKASLSSDGKTLTITSTNMFEGEYGINVTNKVKTINGVALEPYYKQLTYVDTIAPAIAGVSVDDTGVKATIRFSEAIDISGLKVSNATLLPTSSTDTSVDKTTISILNNKLNYVLSEDKKSLTINLSKIASSDFDKRFSITLSGIKDMSGNYPANYIMTTVVYTDTKPKAQARLIGLTRSSYNTLTAVFDRSIENPGWVNVNNGVTLNASIDEKDPKKVHYTLSENEAKLTGIQTVYIGYWNAYNVRPEDTSADQIYERKVNFTVDSTMPVMLKYEFDPSTSILTLTYNKEVELNDNSGVFLSSLETVTDEIRPDVNINYTPAASEDKKVIKLILSNMPVIGRYTFDLDEGFVTDAYRNNCLRRTITISNIGDSSNELPAPYSILQNSANLNEIYIDFSNMVDVPSAVNITNYSIPGVQIISASVKKNLKDSGATVCLTVKDGAISTSVAWPITITGIKGYNGSFAAMSPYTTTVELKDNKKPAYLPQPVFDKTAMNVVKLNFSEEIQGTMEVKVTNIYGSVAYDITNHVSVSGNCVYINLESIPTDGAQLKITILDNKIIDLSGNPSVAMPSQVYTIANY